MIAWTPALALAIYHDGVTVICELASQITGDGWDAPDPVHRVARYRVRRPPALHRGRLPRVSRRRTGEPPLQAHGHRRARASRWRGSLPGRTPLSSPRCPMRQGRSTSRRSPPPRGHTRCGSPVLGPAAPPLPRCPGDGRRHGGQRLRRMASARVGPDPCDAQGLPPGRARGAGRGLAGLPHMPFPMAIPGRRYLSRREDHPTGAREVFRARPASATPPRAACFAELGVAALPRRCGCCAIGQRKVARSTCRSVNTSVTRAIPARNGGPAGSSLWVRHKAGQGTAAPAWHGTVAACARRPAAASPRQAPRAAPWRGGDGAARIVSPRWRGGCHQAAAPAA